MQRIAVPVRSNLDERVRSRLAGGLVVEMAPLGEDLRLGILKSRVVAARTGFVADRAAWWPAQDGGAVTACPVNVVTLMGGRS